MTLVDTHAHIYLDRFADDFEPMLRRAHDADVRIVVQPAIDVASVRKAIALSQKHEGLYAMSAIHPSEVKDATEEDLAAVRELCEAPEVVAVGESGLDYYWDRSYDEKQHEYLRRHARLAMEVNLPLILHSRDKQGSEAVYEDMVRILREERDASDHPERLRGIFHCFVGPRWVAQAADDLGFLVGLGGILTFKNSDLDDVVANVPMRQIVLETDSPYLAPHPHRGKRNEPAYTRLVAQKLAEVKGLSLEEVARVTTENACSLYGIPAPAAENA